MNSKKPHDYSPSFFGQQTRPFYLMNGQRKLLLVSGWKRQSEQGTATTLKTNAHNKCAMSPISAKATMPTEKTIKTIDIPKTLSWKWSIKFSFNTISSKCTKIKNETIKSHQIQLKKFIWKFLVSINVPTDRTAVWTKLSPNINCPITLS